MQGGGAYISGSGSANFTGCNIFDNEASANVRARILNLLEPSSSDPLERYATDCIAPLTSLSCSRREVGCILTAW